MLVIKTVEQKLSKRIKNGLNELGFIIGENEVYYKPNGINLDGISFRVVKVGFDFGIFYSYKRKYSIIEQYYEILKLLINKNWTGNEFTIIAKREILNPSLENTKGHNILKGGGIFLKSDGIDNEIDIFVNLFYEEYEYLITPFLKQTENINWHDKVLNTDILDFQEPYKYFFSLGLMYKKIIVAKLAGNIKFEEIYLTFRRRYEIFLQENQDESAKNELEVLDVLYERLQKVNSLSNPIIA